MDLRLNLINLRHSIAEEIKAYHTSLSHPPYQRVNEAIQFTGTNCNKFTKKFAIRNNTSLNTYTFYFSAPEHPTNNI